jgi:hypothetical protein
MQTITVQDTTPPTIIAPTNLVLECPANTSTNVTGVATAHDGCSAVTITYSDVVSNSCGGTKTISRTWTATDGCGNSASALQTITVRDTTPPTVTAPPNLVLQCPANTATNATGVATTQDGCSAVTLAYSDSVSNTCGGANIISRTWTATDACGNSASAVQTITVQDTTPPTLTVGANRSVVDGQSWSFDQPTAVDNCSTATITVLSTVTNFMASNMFVTRTWVATDACGNSSTAAQTIIVHLTAPSILFAPRSQTVAIGGSTMLGVTAGGSKPFTYQWQFNGSNIPGATSRSLMLNGLQFTNAGSYSVVVANSVGTATSPAAVVNVNPMLAIQTWVPPTTSVIGPGSPGILVLTWAGSFVLQSAPSATGPYTDVLGAASPYSVNPALAPRMYFRLRPAQFSLAMTGVQNNQATLAVAGSPGINFVIQASTDLKSWGNLTTNSAPGTFIDTKAGQYPARYYRVMLVPTK